MRFYTNQLKLRSTFLPVFSAVRNWQMLSNLMGFEPRISGVVSDQLFLNNSTLISCENKWKSAWEVKAMRMESERTTPERLRWSEATNTKDLIDQSSGRQDIWMKFNLTLRMFGRALTWNIRLVPLESCNETLIINYTLPLSWIINPHHTHTLSLTLSRMPRSLSLSLTHTHAHTHTHTHTGTQRSTHCCLSFWHKHPLTRFMPKLLRR